MLNSILYYKIVNILPYDIVPVVKNLIYINKTRNLGLPMKKKIFV